MPSYSYVATKPQHINQLWGITDTTLHSQQEQHQMNHKQLRWKHQQDVCNIAPFVGITSPYLKFCNNKFLLILFLCASFLLLAGNCLPTAIAGTNPRIPYRPPRTEPGECRSIDVRNECETFNQLHNCTVIRGFVLIVVVPEPDEVCDYKKYSFPLLREITDFLIFHNVKGLRSIRDLFPNLTVIRGRRLFMNYALGITRMVDLEVLEFKSLIAIQRGHVYINTSPKLCNLDKINWDRLTLSVGKNNVFPIAPESCPIKTVCQGCPTEYCWSNDVCQLFENHNLIDMKQGIQHCHSECLGGCYNSSSNGCLVCKNKMDHGSCTKECPPDKYLVELFQNCYTESECTQNLNMTIQDDKCLLNCPEDSVFDVDSFDHVGCIPCNFETRKNVYTIFNLADAEKIRGCTTINNNLLITIRDAINENDLVRSFSKLREITGFLKIVRSTGLKSLKFLSSIKSVAGNRDSLEAGVYGLVLYDNENLKDLWQPDNFQINHGSMFVHLNKKLCNRKLREFARKVNHDSSKNSLQVNDQEVLCDPAKLALDIEVLSHRSVKFSWLRAQTSSEVEIMYRPIGRNEEFVEHSELDSDICNRIKWKRILAFPMTLQSNESHYIYIAQDLRPNTRYACLVKTFGLADIYDARSELKYITTKLDLPAPPTINITKKTDVSLTIKLGHSDEDVVDSYVLELYEHPENQAELDRRDFCLQPSYMFHQGETDISDEDHDACCTRKEEELDDLRFTENMRKLFKCDLDHKENCMADNIVAGFTDEPSTSLKAMLRLVYVAVNGTTEVISHLERFRLYTIQVKSCNNAGCGAYAFLWTRTNFSIGGERLEALHACRVSGLNEFHVNFGEPKHPNGMITSYVVHFRQVVPNSEKYRSHIECVTRTQHVYNDYQLIAQLDAPFNEVAVRVYSLAGGFFTNWVPISICLFDSSVVKTGAAPKGEHHIKYGTWIFMAILLLAICMTFAWGCFRSRWWRNITAWRRHLALFWARQRQRNGESENPLVEYRHRPEHDREENSELARDGS